MCDHKNLCWRPGYYKTRKISTPERRRGSLKVCLRPRCLCNSAVFDSSYITHPYILSNKRKKEADCIFIVLSFSAIHVAKVCFLPVFRVSVPDWARMV